MGELYATPAIYYFYGIPPGWPKFFFIVIFVIWAIAFFRAARKIMDGL
jgi:hypothetical protein